MKSDAKILKIIYIETKDKDYFLFSLFFYNFTENFSTRERIVFSR